MKLKELNQLNFNQSEDITIDVSSLYFHYAEKEIYDLLKENAYNHGYLLKLTRTSYKKDESKYTSQQIEEHYYNFYFLLINTLTEKEKQELLDLALTTVDIRFAAILLSNPKISLTETQFDAIFNINGKYREQNQAYKYRTLKEYLILNNNIPLTEEQYHNGLLNFDYGLNLIFSQRNQVVPSHIIDQLIQVEESNLEDILINILNRKQTMFTEKQIDYCLNGSFLLRLSCALNYQFNFTEEQIIKGLNDTGFEYFDYGDSEVSNEDIDYNGSEVEIAFLENTNIKIPQEYIDLIFSDSNFKYHIEYLLKRHDFCLNEEQLNYIIQLKNEITYLILDKYILNDKQILELLYTSQYWKKALAKKYLNREDIKLSDTIINVLKLQNCEEIQQVLQLKYNI